MFETRDRTSLFFIKCSYAPHWSIRLFVFEMTNITMMPLILNPRKSVITLCFKNVFHGDIMVFKTIPQMPQNCEECLIERCRGNRRLVKNPTVFEAFTAQEFSGPGIHRQSRNSGGRQRETNIYPNFIFSDQNVILLHVLIIIKNFTVGVKSG